MRALRLGAGYAARRARAVPLREPPAGGGAEENDLHAAAKRDERNGDEAGVELSHYGPGPTRKRPARAGLFCHWLAAGYVSRHFHRDVDYLELWLLPHRAIPHR